jgi:hypothetical protein
MGLQAVCRPIALNLRHRNKRAFSLSAPPEQPPLTHASGPPPILAEGKILLSDLHHICVS